MLGLIVSLLVSASAAATATAPMPSAGVSCADGPASCDAAAPTMADDAADVAGADADLPRGYATPAVIDCRVAVVPAVLQTLVGECDGTPRDASYRVSRYPESEASDGSLVPARDRAHAVAVWRGLPPEGGDVLSSSSPAQPLALFAVPRLPVLATRTVAPDAAFAIRSRATDPPERPPRV